MIAQEAFKPIASEGGHWYARDGTPVYEVPNASKPGEMRPTTIRDARKMNLIPSVSGILKVMGKGDGLTHWVKKQVAMAAFRNQPLELEPLDLWMGRILDSAEKEMSVQRDIGTADHAAVERYFQDLAKMMEEQYEMPVYPIPGHSRAVEASISALKQFGVWGQQIDSEKSFASPLGYGGKIDLSGRSDCWIVDFKFVDRLEKKLDYIDKCAQGAAYLVLKYGLDSLSTGRFANIFIETQEYCFVVREWTKEELLRGWEVFRLCTHLWFVLNNYDPRKS